MDTLLQALRNVGPVRLAVVGAVMMAVLAFFIFVTGRIATPQMSMLYGELDMKDSSRIVAELEAQNIPFELREGGRAVWVPDDRVLRSRMSMADKGLPSGGSIGYELFDQSDSLGATNFQQQVNLVRALEGELARTIRTIENVKAARVHLVLPRRELFTREKQEPSASVILKMEGKRRLEAEQVAAIQHLVATAIPDLNPNRISIVDDKGALLARGFDEEAQLGLVSAKAEQRRRDFENRTARTVEQLLEKVVGLGRVRAEVTADIDYNRISTTAEEFDPEGQVVRSTQTVEEESSTQESENAGDVSVANNLPDATGNTQGGTATQAERRNEETVNFEITKTVTNTVKEGGEIIRLSVAVLVDGIRAVDPENNPTYADRTAEDLQRLTDLVKGAIGYQESRKDTVTVLSMEFAELGLGEADEEELFLGLEKKDLLRMAEVLVLSIVAILVILLVVRPLVSRALEAMPPPSSGMPEGLLTEDGLHPALAAPGMPGVPVPGEEMEEGFDELIDIDRVEGRVKASSVKKVGEIVEKHPEEALAIIRSWMYQE